MKTFLLLPLALFFNSAVLQCDNEDPFVPAVLPNVLEQNPPCNPGELPSTSLEQVFGCTDTRYSTNINLNNTYVLIRSQAEFNQYATSPCNFNIDLTNYDLIIGKKQLTSGNQSIRYEYTTTDCITKKLKVIFQQDATLNAPNITYHRLIPKIGNSEILVVETVVNN